MLAPLLNEGRQLADGAAQGQKSGPFLHFPELGIFVL